MLLHPKEELLEALPLTAPVKQALLNQQGKLGQMLEIVMLCERGLWDNTDSSPVSIAELGKAYLNATKWTIDIQTAL
jgi:c-di-GMP-related signal transduction protein